MSDVPVALAPAEAEVAPPERRGARWNLAGVAALGLFMALLVLGGWSAWRDPGFQASTAKAFGETYGTLHRTLVEEIFLNPWFYGVFALVLLLVVLSL